MVNGDDCINKIEGFKGGYLKVSVELSSLSSIEKHEIHSATEPQHSFRPKKILKGINFPKKFIHASTHNTHQKVTPNLPLLVSVMWMRYCHPNAEHLELPNENAWGPVRLPPSCLYAEKILCLRLVIRSPGICTLEVRRIPTCTFPPKNQVIPSLMEFARLITNSTSKTPSFRYI